MVKLIAIDSQTSASLLEYPLYQTIETKDVYRLTPQLFAWHQRRPYSWQEL
jgi:hypothetical protein